MIWKAVPKKEPVARPAMMLAVAKDLRRNIASAISGAVARCSTMTNSPSITAPPARTPRVAGEVSRS